MLVPIVHDAIPSRVPDEPSCVSEPSTPPTATGSPAGKLSSSAATAVSGAHSVAPRTSGRRSEAMPTQYKSSLSQHQLMLSNIPVELAVIGAVHNRAVTQENTRSLAPAMELSLPSTVCWTRYRSFAGQ